MNSRYPKAGTRLTHDEQNIFLTATSGQPQQANPQKLQLSPSNNQPKFSELQEESDETLKMNILSLIKEFKTFQSNPQISHLFNEILYALDGSHGERKSIQKITEWLATETNVIKLTRVWNRLKNLKKQADKLGLDKLKNSQQNSYTTIKARQPLTSPNNFNRTFTAQRKEVNQIKEQILSQISYRQRLMKIQSQRERHEENRKKNLQKKLLKAKEMNKKVKEIYEKNKNSQKEKIYEHKFENLFDSEDINDKKRGKKINKKTLDDDRSELSFNNQKIAFSNIRSNDKCKTIKPESPEGKMQINTKKNIKFFEKEQDKYTKQDMMTFKSLKDLVSQNIKRSKSFKNIVKDKKWGSKHLMTQKPQQQYYNKQSPQYISRSISLGKNQNSISAKDFTKMNEEKKLNLVKTKKQELEEQRLNKVISEAVQKEQRILQIYERKNLQSKKKKNTQQGSQRDFDHIKSFDSSPVKSLFKKVIVTKKELLDKQRRIFMDIENKIENKQQFLQERVERVRQRLKKQQEIKRKHRQAWSKYINFSQSVSAMQSRNISPHQKEKQNLVKVQEKVVKKSYFTKLKKMQSNAQSEKLTGLSIRQLKKKLTDIETQEANKNQQKIIF